MFVRQRIFVQNFHRAPIEVHDFFAWKKLLPVVKEVDENMEQVP